ncbi:DUF3806 domain-containing protein [Actinotalea ferrariae]|uniref:DUF3806 domain-containing protein n=1 Tax=Actinotalea ferrariae TaxID=1386098 RepID=UPI0005540FB3|nr:DUF3806 domain-containing protein [Actinotalea ferrariae]
MSIFRRRAGRDGDTHGTEPVRSSPQVLALNPAELAWVADLRASLPGGGVDLDPVAVGRVYDDALDAWLAAPPSGRFDPNGVINAIGVAVGDAICARVPGARWAGVTEDGSTELAIVLPPPVGPTVFPTSSVGQRWAAGERAWIPEFVEWVTGRLLALGAEPSAQVHELASFALAHAVRSVVPEGGPLVPFTLLETAEGRSLHRFAGELGEAVEHARRHARGSGAVRVAVAWDGYLTGEGRREDALFVEASEPGQPSVVVAHRYVETADGAQAVGEPLTVGHGAPLL